MTTFYVKKIWSLNPTKYKYIALDKAHKAYIEYLIACTQYKGTKAGNIKLFVNWLRTEI